MFDSYNYLKALKKNIEAKQNAYNLALDKLEMCLSKINKGIIHGRKEQSLINCIKQYVSELTRASYELELAMYQKSSFLKNGVIQYE